MALARPQEVQIDWYAIEEPWTLRQNEYTSRPEGNALEIANHIINYLSYGNK